MGNSGELKVTKYINDFISGLKKWKPLYPDNYKNSLFSLILFLKSQNFTPDKIKMLENFFTKNEEVFSLFFLRILTKSVEENVNTHICLCPDKEHCGELNKIYEEECIKLLINLSRVESPEKIDRLDTILNDGREIMLLFSWRFIRISGQRKINEQMVDEYYITQERNALEIRKEKNEDDTSGGGRW